MIGIYAFKQVFMNNMKVYSRITTFLDYINQTKYKIYIVLSCRVKVMAPFCSRTFDTSTTVLLAETVILGEVPDSFVQVPEEDILDVT